jgi:hypothetical protein
MEKAEDSIVGSSASSFSLDEAAMIDEVDGVGLPGAQEQDLPSNEEPNQSLSTGKGKTVRHMPEELRSEPSNSKTRPVLQRNDSVPAESQLHPIQLGLSLQSQEDDLPTDSLSLTQLRSLVREMPKAEKPSYTFVYNDASSFPEEIEEWFSYSPDDQNALQDAKRSFIREWVMYNGLKEDDGSAYLKGDIDWTEVDDADRQRFVQDAIAILGEEDSSPSVCASLERLVYIALGCWHETAGQDISPMNRAEAGEDGTPPSPNNFDRSFRQSSLQLKWIKQNVQLMCNAGGFNPVYELFKNSCLREW